MAGMNTAPLSVSGAAAASRDRRRAAAMTRPAARPCPAGAAPGASPLRQYLRGGAADPAAASEPARREDRP